MMKNNSSISPVEKFVQWALILAILSGIVYFIKKFFGEDKSVQSNGLTKSNPYNNDKRHLEINSKHIEDAEIIEEVNHSDVRK